MTLGTLIELLSQLAICATRGVTEQYNPDEPEFTVEAFGYSPLQNTGREWYHYPIDELIYQEYSDRETISSDYFASRNLDIKVIDACTPEQNETQKDEQEERASMAWKLLRPSGLSTVYNSMFNAALITLGSASLVGAIYMLTIYLSFNTVQNCHFQPMNTTSVNMQWIRSMSDVVSCAFLYIWSVVLFQILFRPFQLIGVKLKLFISCLFFYLLDSSYRIALQALGISHSKISALQKIPLNAIFLINQCFLIFLLANHFCLRTREKVVFVIQMITPACFCFLMFFIVGSLIYPVFNAQDANGKLLIAVFAPLVGILLKVISRICSQRFYYFFYPGFSYVLLSPLYFVSALIFRVLQADLGNLQSIAILGVIHGAAEVIERSTMVVVDHFCHALCKRRSSSWGSFRTPRRERLMADIAIMGMLSESTAIVAVNGFSCLFELVLTQHKNVLTLFMSFVKQTSVSLLIEWFFTSLSVAIGTRYQNMAVIAIWRRRWKRHILVAIVNAVPMAMWTASNLLTVVDNRFHDASIVPCKMPFSQ
ncbi:uncharacterized protein LOC114969680 [Acropora millepora]|uniref:uncharacterized protein LOC114969680 n=1 Tax=Acropora millepora TaxID=45264 RepID=UPI001CF3FFBD|nr:uncharacterized protein LOC114969680 [Acropora millepora]